MNNRVGGRILRLGDSGAGNVQPGITARLRKPLHRGEFPTWTETDLLLALTHPLPERLRRALVLAAHTGQRRSDLIAITWADYDGETIKLVQLKTKWKLTLPCPVELRAELDAWKAEADVVGLDGTGGCHLARRLWRGVGGRQPVGAAQHPFV